MMDLTAEESIFFESSLKSDQIKKQMQITSNIGNTWNVEELWYLDDYDLMQQITLKKETIEDCFKTYYYVSLEIFQIFPKYLPKPQYTIQKSTRANSSCVQFEIYFSEYRQLKDFSTDLKSMLVIPSDIVIKKNNDSIAIQFIEEKTADMQDNTSCTTTMQSCSGDLSKEKGSFNGSENSTPAILQDMSNVGDTAVQESSKTLAILQDRSDGEPTAVHESSTNPIILQDRSDDVSVSQIINDESDHSSDDSIVNKDYSEDFAFMGVKQLSKTKFTAMKIYGIKIVLTPIIPLVKAPYFPIRISKKRKRTKGRFIDGLKELSLNILSLLSDHENNAIFDVILQCGSIRKKTHRNLLCARSVRFCNLFHRIVQDGTESQILYSSTEILIRSGKGKNIVSISQLESSFKYNDNKPTLILNPKSNAKTCFEIYLDDIDPSIFNEFINFIYDGQYRSTTVPRTIQLYSAAYDYGINDLESKCLLSLKTLITDETVFEVLDFACSIDNEELFDSCIKTIKGRDNFEEFITEHAAIWEDILRKYPAIEFVVFEDRDQEEESAEFLDLSDSEGEKHDVYPLGDWFDSDSYPSAIGDGSIGYFIDPNSQPFGNQ